LVSAERKAAHDPFWVRLTEEDRARLDGRLAAEGYGRWRIHEALRKLGLSKEELYQRVREGEVIVYRARVGDHWEWRVSPADHEQQALPPPQHPSAPIGLMREGELGQSTSEA
jgi:hypothetical protein